MRPGRRLMVGEEEEEEVVVRIVHISNRCEKVPCLMRLKIKHISI